MTEPVKVVGITMGALAGHAREARHEVDAAIEALKPALEADAGKIQELQRQASQAAYYNYLEATCRRYPAHHIEEWPGLLVGAVLACTSSAVNHFTLRALGIMPANEEEIRRRTDEVPNQLEGILRAYRRMRARLERLPLDTTAPGPRV